MKTALVDETMAKLLSTAAPEMSVEWEARAMEQLTATRPARGISRRLVLAAIGIAALIGLGFVPIPMGSAPGALERAMAAMDGARTFHVVLHSSYNDRVGQMAEWWSSDGLHRLDVDFDEGWNQSVDLEDGQHRLSYHSFMRNERLEQRGSCSDRGPGAPFIHREPVFPGERAAVYRVFSFLRDAKGWAVSEKRERSLWGGAVDVVEAEGVERGGSVAFPITSAGGDAVRYRAELDSGTGRLLSLVQCVLMEDGRWKPTYWAEAIEWDVDIPESVRNFQFPPGTEVIETRWFADRTTDVIVDSTTRDWHVALHTIEADAKGRLYLTLSRWPTQDNTADIALANGHWSFTLSATTAVDQYGTEYVQSNARSDLTDEGGYWTAVLEPQSHVIPLTLPRSIAVTVRLYRRVGERDQSGSWTWSDSQGQTVTFTDLARPLLQRSTDLFADSARTVTY